MKPQSAGILGKIPSTGWRYLPVRTSAVHTVVCALALALSGGGMMTSASAADGTPDLEARFDCARTIPQSVSGEPETLYSDSGRIHIKNGQILELQWDSSVYRDMHGLECSIDANDMPTVEGRRQGSAGVWDIALKDAVKARAARGYDNFNHGTECSIQVVRQGNIVGVLPSCPALCGARANFSSFNVNLATGSCQYPDLPAGSAAP